MSYFFLNPGYQGEKQPAVRIDYNISEKHRLTGTYNHFFEWRAQDHINGADKRFPGSPNYRQVRTTQADALDRAPLDAVATTWSASCAAASRAASGCSLAGQSWTRRTSATFDDTNGYALNLDQNIGLTDWHITNTLSSRSGYQYTLDETLNWQKGKHSITIGGSAFLGRAWEDSQQLTTGIDIGFDTTNDPAGRAVQHRELPGRVGGAADRRARALRAAHRPRHRRDRPGRARSRDEQIRQPRTRRREGKLDVFSAFAQDSWRVTPTLTLNAGVRWDVQMPFSPSNDTMTTASLADICGVSGIGSGGIYDACNFYAPGASGGKVPEFTQLTSGTRGYNTDWNNFAPNVGVAWRPNVESGWLRTLLGDPEQATLRGGYSEAFERQGIGGFTGIYGPNPGSTLSLTRNASTGLVGPGESWPVLLRETEPSVSGAVS